MTVVRVVERAGGFGVVNESHKNLSFFRALCSQSRHEHNTPASFLHISTLQHAPPSRGSDLIAQIMIA